MIENGWAHARYDSRDGLRPRTPVEDAYVGCGRGAYGAPGCGW